MAERKGTRQPPMMGKMETVRIIVPEKVQVAERSLVPHSPAVAKIDAEIHQREEELNALRKTREILTR
jgi:hypothetical protein